MSRDNSVLRFTTVALKALYDCMINYELDINLNNFKNYFKLRILYKNDLRISTAGELVEIVKNIKFDQKNDNISQIIDHIKYRCESGIVILNWRFT